MNKKHVELKLSGMSCTACAARIEKVLRQLPGVIEAGVNFATEKAVVEYQGDQLKVSDIKQAVAKAGYVFHINTAEKNITNNLDKLLQLVIVLTIVIISN